MYYIVYVQGEQEDWIQAVFMHQKDALEYLETVQEISDAGYKRFHLGERKDLKGVMDWLSVLENP